MGFVFLCSPKARHSFNPPIFTQNDPSKSPTQPDGAPFFTFLSLFCAPSAAVLRDASVKKVRLTDQPEAGTVCPVTVATVVFSLFLCLRLHHNQNIWSANRGSGRPTTPDL